MKEIKFRTLRNYLTKNLDRKGGDTLVEKRENILATDEDASIPK